MSQEAPPAAGPSAPSCEAQVQEQYRKLTTDGLLAPSTAQQWGPQLAAIIHKVRLARNQYELKKQQAEVYEQNVVELAEQLRQAREQVTALQADVEKLRGKPATN